VESGRLSASSMNGQPWHFIIVQDKAMLEQLGSIAQTGPYIAQAPLAIVIAITDSIFAVSDASRAIQSMMLTGWAAGVGSNWVGFSGGRLDAIKPVLGIPNEMDILAILPFGYPTNTIGKGNKKRKPLGEVASKEHFGQPYQ
jgi:nitroreductase